MMHACMPSHVSPCISFLINKAFMRDACAPRWSEDDVKAFADGQAAGWAETHATLARVGKAMALSLFTARDSNRGAIDGYVCEATQSK